MTVTYALTEKEVTEKEPEGDMTLLRLISGNKVLLAGSSLVPK